MNGQHGYYLEDLSVGMREVFAKTVTDSDIVGFADITGDTNPIHLDEAFAAGSLFKARIAHGMLSAGLISAVLGTRLPGPGCIYLRQDLRFKAPVKVGDTVEARVTVREIQAEKKRVVFDTVCTVRGGVVLEGEATLMVASRKDMAEQDGANDATAPRAPQAAE